MSIFDINHWRYIDQSTLGHTFNPLQSFAIDDTLCASVGEGVSSPSVRTWVHQDTIVLGIQDSRLPYIKAGINYLNSLGYKVIVRNSGGLAVVLDEGVLNISLILKENRHFSINSGYDAMYELICAMFKEETNNIEAGEIIGSYCPGSYDLSIDGKKFAGISQRRVRGGVAVQIYLCVNGSGRDRAAVIKEFYHLSIAGTETKFSYPEIIPSTMASLTELLKIELTVQDVMLRLLKVLQQQIGATIEPSQITVNEMPLFETNLQRMIKRNNLGI
ncbi:lipoate--protein ligase family protein [Anaerobacillus alkalidiazotrophicus]|uniref:lipoate--protein ligase family protein n=1 Tax=Anaerobacillus alkalidiazotrophicus TaxID=472963 RepID=UPI000AEBE5B3|nr:biotin/lipoate A/B protein ligase family protein [Anaerobacillus alkalidiazotrophicus]